MKNIFKRFFAICLALVMVLSMVACNKNEVSEKEKEKALNDYGIGLDENGYYETLDKYPLTVPDYSQKVFEVDDIIQWYVENVETNEVTSLDDYVKAYGQEFLNILGLANVDVIEDGNYVTATLEFYQNNKLMEDYVTTDTYIADKDGDSIVKSFIDHKIGDEYETQYTFPAEDTEHGSETVVVKIKIDDAVLSDPIGAGIVEANLDILSQFLGNVTDSESYLVAIRPRVAEALLPAYMDYVLQSDETVSVPEEFVDWEMRRLEARLEYIGYTMDEYLTAMQMTKEEARSYCTDLTRQNYICMTMAKELNVVVDDELLVEHYGDNYDYIKELQGVKYMKLDVMRGSITSDLSDHVGLSINGEPIQRYNDFIESLENAAEGTENTESDVVTESDGEDVETEEPTTDEAVEDASTNETTEKPKETEEN